jgi:hypothetical protein
MMPAIRSLAAALAVCFPLSALAGQVSYEESAVAEARSRAELVVTLKLGAKAMQSAKIPTAPPRGYAPGGNLRKASAKPCGPYEFGAWVGTVEKVHAPAQHAPVKAGERLVIFPAETGTLLELTRRACEEGGSKSPIFRRMKGGAEPKDGASLVALLRWEETVGWVEAMGGSWLAQPPPEPEKTRRALHGWTRGDDALCLADEDCAVVVPPKLGAEGELVCGVCPPCALTADTAMAKAAAQRAEAMCAKQRADQGVVVTCEACAPTQKQAQCKAMRCSKK